MWEGLISYEGWRSSAYEDVKEGTVRKRGWFMKRPSCYLPFGATGPLEVRSRGDLCQTHMIQTQSITPRLMNPRVRILVGHKTSEMSVFICCFAPQIMCNRWMAFKVCESVWMWYFHLEDNIEIHMGRKVLKYQIVLAIYDRNSFNYRVLMCPWNLWVFKANFKALESKKIHRKLLESILLKNSILFPPVR